jgi:lipoate---protein ligase
LIKKPILHLLQLTNIPILQQLQWEEALLRADERNWCLINQGSPPAIVIGISGQPAQLINSAKMMTTPLPLIRRFSGGGTVVIDESTLFITLICHQEALKIAPYPRPIMEWTASLYHPLFPSKTFALEENDYTVNGRKWGGNAQMITKNRWLHHTSILWDYQEEKMDYLLFPPKTPAYRQNRPHSEFICRLSDYWSTIESFQTEWLAQISQQFDVIQGCQEELEEIVKQPHRKTTALVN